MQVQLSKVANGVVRGNVGIIKFDFIAKGFNKNISNFCCAVVVKIIVEVFLVFRLGILLQIIKKYLFLLLIEVDDLLMNPPIVVEIIIPKVRVGLNRQLIEQVSSGEIEIEVGLIKIEGAVVVGIINSVNGIVYSDGTMSKGRV